MNGHGLNGRGPVWWVPFEEMTAETCQANPDEIKRLYSMKIKEQTRKRAAGCSKHCFEVSDGTDVVSSKYCLRLQIELTKSAQNTVLRLQIELTKSVSYRYGKVTLTWFEFDFRRVLVKRLSSEVDKLLEIKE